MAGDDGGGNRDDSRGNAQSADSGEIKVVEIQNHNYAVRGAYDDLLSAVLLVALKHPESDLGVVRSILDGVEENQLVSE
jgi:hypothetical protein